VCTKISIYPSCISFKNLILVSKKNDLSPTLSGSGNVKYLFCDRKIKDSIFVEDTSSFSLKAAAKRNTEKNPFTNSG